MKIGRKETKVWRKKMKLQHKEMKIRPKEMKVFSFHSSKFINGLPTLLATGHRGNRQGRP
jgi:hypothetical protein